MAYEISVLLACSSNFNFIWLVTCLWLIACCLDFFYWMQFDEQKDQAVRGQAQLAGKWRPQWCSCRRGCRCHAMHPPVQPSPPRFKKALSAKRAVRLSLEEILFRRA
jgi:hypothetical protein